jgi:hypothetical protein
MAWFYKGFVFERDDKDRLTVEGNVVSDRQAPKSDKLLIQRAHKYIDNSPELMTRKTERAKHLQILRSGRDDWNQWRRRHPEIHPMLAFQNFNRRDPGLKLDGYDFSYTNFTQAKLRTVSLRGANFHQAILAKADLRGAHLEEANFCRTDFYETNFEGASLTGANLQGVQLTKTNLKGADLRGCRIYGLSAWDLEVSGAQQNGLQINYDELVGGRRTARHASVDGVDVASFIYYTLNNKNIAQVIEATKRQWVLLLGRFTTGHKEVLEELAEGLRRLDYIPITFDFGPPRSLDLIESIILIAGLSRLVLVDITAPKSTPLELYAIAPHFAVPVVPIIRKGTEPFALFPGLRKFPWVKSPVEFDDPRQLDVRALLRRADLDMSIGPS